MADVTSIDSRRKGGAAVPVKGKRVDAIHCLLMPLHEDKILLPNAAVAEVIGYVSPEPVKDAPEWLLGHISWRDHMIPLISFELASGGQGMGVGSRIAVLNTLNGNANVPYIGVQIQGIPQLRLVQEHSINLDETQSNNSRMSVAAVVESNGEPTLVPDLDDLEARLEKLRIG